MKEKMLETLKKRKLWVGLGVVVLLALGGLVWWWNKPMTPAEIQQTVVEQEIKLKQADAVLDEWKEMGQKYQSKTTESPTTMTP